MLQIRLLGQFDIRMDGKRVTIPTRAGQSLLAYITLTAGTPHRREKLAGLFWPDTSDESARKNLRQELWRIRKALAGQNPTTDYLLADEYAITFNRNADYWLDATQLERPDLDIESLTSNLSLYQDELLPGFFDDWIVLERERIQTIFETKMEQLLSQLVAAERWIAVQEQAERWLALGNTPEPAFRALMLAHGARGDIAKVSSVYQRCIADLDEKIGLEPSAETRALYDGLLKGTHTPTRTATFQQSGTITFLFTDIEESTNLLDKLGNDYAAVLADHHQIMRAAIQKWNGHEVDTQGDAFFVTFARAMDAIQCAADAQRALASHPWIHGKPLRVRMGLHTGEPLIASTGYVGMDVHRAARIGDSAHGGQVLLSHTTRELVVNDIPQGLSIRDLGEHRLKDLKFPTPIYQLVMEGLAVDFPPIRTKFSGTEAPTAGEPPFKGLQYFDEVDAELFFGREVLTAKLVKRLSESQFLSVIIGASGSGKSSVVRAGVIPSLKKGVALIDGTVPPADSTNWRVHILTPTAHPLEALATELTRESESVTSIATLMDDLMQDPRSLGLFLGRQNPKRHTLLVLDQFEELFTLCRDDFEREAFIDNLLTAISGAGQTTLILTLRADFYAHLAQYPELRDAVAHQQEYIGPMTTEELRRAIEEPAKRAYWTFEPGLVDLILRDVGDEPGALPLLSHALLETWKRRAGHTLTLKGYADAGGVRGAIAHTAESVYQNLSMAEQAITRNIFLRLTELGEGTEDTRRRTSFNELMSYADDMSEVRAVLNLLAEARLITLGEDTVEVAHEALIREWPTLREWLTQDRNGLLLHRQLTDAAHEWELLEHDSGSVYRGARLAQAREWAILHPNILNAGERDFLEASNEHEQGEQTEREAQRQRELEAAKELAETQSQSASRLRTRNRVITTVGTIAIILAMLAGMLGLQSNRNAITAQNNAISAQSNAATAQVAKDNALNAQATAEAERLRAESEKQLAVSRELAIAAVDNLDVDPERSILLALKAIEESDTPEAEDALHRAVQTSRVQFTLSHADQVWAVDYSPDGSRLATASYDGTAKVWDTTTSLELLILKTGSIDDIAFSPNGTQLATVSLVDSNAKIWDASTGRLLITFSGHTGGVSHVAFDPDGTRIATASADGTAKVWDVSNGKELFTLVGHADIVSSVSFSPDGTRLITSSWDATVKVWDATTGRELNTISGIFDEAVSVAYFSPDGTRIFVAVSDLIRVFDAATGQELFTMTGHNNTIYDIAFSSDGMRLATASIDATAKVWDAATGEVLLTLSGHVSSLYDVTFSPDGLHVATTSSDGTAKIWNISPEGNREWLTLARHNDWVFRVVVSPDGTRLATASFDGTAKIFDAETGAELFVLSGHTDWVYGIGFSPDGTRLATSSSDQTVKLWDATTGKELITLSEPGHGDGIVGGSFPGILAVTFSPDGRYLASAGADGTVIIWDIETGKPFRTFSNQGTGFTNVAFSPDGLYIVTASDQPAGTEEEANAKLWDLETGQTIFEVSQPVRIWGVAFSPDGTRFATAGFDGIASVWDTETGKEIINLSGHSSTVIGISFSPDGKYIATASVDGTAKLWDSETGNELLTLTASGRTMLGVSFTPDGRRLITSGADGAVRIYLLKIEELIALAKSRLTRSLTTEECQKYLHVDACPAAP